MTNIKGTVEKVLHKDWNQVKLWSFQIEGDARFFKTGTTQPPVEVGQVVEFSEGNGKVDLITIKVLGTAAEMPEVAKAPSAPVITSLGRDEYWARREQRDIEQEARRRKADARRDAAAVVVAALHTDHLPHAANIAKGKRLDLVTGYVNELTKLFLEEEANG